MYSKPYKNQIQEKSKLKVGDLVAFTEGIGNLLRLSGEVVAIDRNADIIVIETDVDKHQLNDFKLSEIILHCDAEWPDFKEKT